MLIDAIALICYAIMIYGGIKFAGWIVLNSSKWAGEK